MKDFPNSGWVEKQLGEVVTITKTKGGSRPLPYVGLEDISSGGTGEFTGSLEPQGDKSTTFEFGPDHLLYGRLRPYLNKVYRPDFEGHCSSEIFPILPGECLDRGYLFHWITSDQVVEKINATCTGARMPRANVKEILQFPIPLPPLEEQQRIVAVLDEAFEGLARARAHADANLSDAEQIAARSLDVILEDLSTRNGRITIDGIAAVKGGKRLPKGSKPVSTPTPYPYISVKDLTEDGTVSTDKLGYISEQVQRSIARYTISSRDVYISIAGTIGKSGIVPDELDGANLTENAAKLVLKEGWTTEYVYWCTRSADFAVQTSEQTRVAAQPKLALQRLGAITIPKASEAEQIAVCETMNALRVTRSELVEAYREKLQDIDELRQSILQKAFAGDLT
ncbi:MAG: restriction endonuclease subunit S [Paracoccaceae bacterium]|nr:restriction endonuclease subunit S [Paracoccaceae bacterium]